MFSNATMKVDGAAMGGYLIVALIKGLDGIWGVLIVPKLVDLENYRTAGEKEKAKIYKIVYVKLINVLYPYVYTAFRKRHVVECGLDPEGSETCLPGNARFLFLFPAAGGLCMGCRQPTSTIDKLALVDPILS